MTTPGGGTTPAARVRFNTTIAAATATLIEAQATAWGVSKGEAIDRLVEAAVGAEGARLAADLGGDTLEATLRGVITDYTLQTARTLEALLEGARIEITTTRLLLFALLANTKGPESAIANEDQALRVARSALPSGEIPLMLRAGRTGGKP